MTMFIAFGVTFEVPIAVILLVKSGMVTVQKLRAARGYVIVGAFIIAAVVTPPDVVSQFMLALPLCLLFELRSEEHTSELQSLMRISYAVFCLKKKKYKHINTSNIDTTSIYI